MIGYVVAAVALICAAAAIVIIFMLKRKNTKNITLDEIIGEKCVVTERVDNFIGGGIVKVKGCQWAARGVSDNDVFEVGESLCVVAIEGVKLVCRKK
jgi:membrane protein implicated in regulation of membrane protease activity